jgi:hypothetical protein
MMLNHSVLDRQNAKQAPAPNTHIERQQRQACKKGVATVMIDNQNSKLPSDYSKIQYLEVVVFAQKKTTTSLGNLTFA